MFDVSWSDPASETVAQHRQRKEREDSKNPQTGRRSSLKSSSTGSSSSSSRTQVPVRSGWGLFGGLSTTKKSSSTSKSSATSKSSDSSRSKTPSISKSQPTPAAVSSYDDRANNESRNTVRDRGRDRDMINEYVGSSRQSVAETVQSSAPSTAGESMFSAYQGRSVATESSWGGSMSDRASKNWEPPTSPIESRGLDLRAYQDDRLMSSHLNKMHISLQDNIPEDFELDIDDMFPRVPQHQQSYQRNPVSTRSRDRDQADLPSRPSSRAHVNRALPPPPQPKEESTHAQRQIKRMEAASAKIILERLKEEWTEVTDPAIYKDLEFDNQLWMLVGLKYLVTRASLKAMEDGEGVVGPVKSLPAGKVLSLYETQASATYLSSLGPSPTETHHHSSSPATSTQIPSLRALLTPTPLARLPYAANFFTTVSSLPLASILASPSIPTLLRDINRILAPGGILHLTIMDPLPDASSAGPKMRAWMEDNLILNLETQFRCLKPGRLLPIWLKDAGFAVPAALSKSASERPGTAIDGATTYSANMTPPLSPPLSALPVPPAASRVTRLKFPALAKGEGGYAARGTVEEKGKRELGMLSATVGRMLWREIWGSYVTGDKWWWEDEAIVEECKRLGTRWEVSIWEALKV